MHPLIMRQLATEHIKEIHAKAEGERRARQARRARRRAPSARPGPAVSGTLSYDDPRLDTGPRPAMHEQPSAPLPVMAGAPPATGSRADATKDCAGSGG